jgi:hypothetical protein
MNAQIADDQIVGMMIALLIAGQHTSNVTGTWTGLHMLSSPDCTAFFFSLSRSVLCLQRDCLCYVCLRDCIILHQI